MSILINGLFHQKFCREENNFKAPKIVKGNIYIYTNSASNSSQLLSLQRVSVITLHVLLPGHCHERGQEWIFFFFLIINLENTVHLDQHKDAWHLARDAGQDGFPVSAIQYEACHHCLTGPDKRYHEIKQRTIHLVYFGKF